MASKNPTRSTRLPEGLDDEFEAYRDGNDMTNSEALRTLVREGFESERSDPLDERPDGTLAGLLWDARRDVHTFVLASLIAVLVSTTTAGIVSTAFLAVAFGYALTVVLGAVDAVVLDSRVTVWLDEWSDRRDLGVRT